VSRLETENVRKIRRKRNTDDFHPFRFCKNNIGINLEWKVLSSLFGIEHAGVDISNPV
jgi:hypothetical protein